MFRSGLERKFQQRFKSLPYETGRISYVSSHTYTPDFHLGGNLWVECKGRFVGADRSKHLLIKKQNPEVRVLFVFQEPHRKISKVSKTSYADWCTKNGFVWISFTDSLSHTPTTLRKLLQSSPIVTSSKSQSTP